MYYDFSRRKQTTEEQVMDKAGALQRTTIFEGKGEAEQSQISKRAVELRSKQNRYSSLWEIVSLDFSRV